MQCSQTEQLGGPNYDHCETYILVQDNMFNTCNQPGPGMIAGTLTTEYGDALEGSTVYLSGVLALPSTV